MDRTAPVPRPHPPRRLRRDLERRADRLLRELRGAPIDVPIGASARTHCILAGEHAAPLVVPRTSVAAVLEGGRELFAEIAAEDDGVSFPVLINLDGWLQVAFLALLPMSIGGAA